MSIKGHYCFINGKANVNIGGVMGYVGRLHKAFEEHDNKNSSNFIFTPEAPTPHAKAKKRKEQTYIKSIIKQIDLNYLKSIHVHGEYNFFQCYNFIQKYKPSAKIIYTSHNAIGMSNQFLLNGFLDSFKDKKAIYNATLKNEVLSYKKADVLVFPKYAYECLLEEVPSLKSIFKQKIIKHLPTGTMPLAPNNRFTKNDLYEKYSIKKNSFVCVYVGNTFKIKNPSLLLEIAKKVKDNNITFLCVGVGNRFVDEVKQNRLTNIITVSHLANEEILSILNVSDCVLSTGSKNFFDLALVECTSIGIPMIFTNTGGNKFFKENSIGVVSCKANSTESYINAIYKIKSASKEDLEKMRQANKDMYENYFSLEKFYSNYTNIIKEIHEEFNI